MSRRILVAAQAPEGARARPRKAVWCRFDEKRDAASANHPGASRSRGRFLASHHAVSHCAFYVEATMRAYARKLGEDAEKWGIVGLLHDFDYERWPTPPDHPLQGAEILRQRGYPDDVIYAIKSHADYLTDCPRVHLIDRALYACDELCGFIVAVALLRPAGVMNLNAASVKKKLKRKEFAKNVSREDIDRGANDFGVDLTEHIQFLIEALRPVAAELGIETGAGGEGD